MPEGPSRTQKDPGGARRDSGGPSRDQKEPGRAFVLMSLTRNRCNRGKTNTLTSESAKAGHEKWREERDAVFRYRQARRRGSAALFCSF